MPEYFSYFLITAVTNCNFCKWLRNIFSWLTLLFYFESWRGGRDKENLALHKTVYSLLFQIVAIKPTKLNGSFIGLNREDTFFLSKVDNFSILIYFLYLSQTLERQYFFAVLFFVFVFWIGECLIFCTLWYFWLAAVTPTDGRIIEVRVRMTSPRNFMYFMITQKQQKLAMDITIIPRAFYYS